MPKPTHLTWEEAAVNALCNSTAYRMLVSHNGAPMKQGDQVLVWGASGGLGQLRRPVRAERRGGPGRAWSPRPRRWTSSTTSGWRRSSTARPRATGSGRDEHTQDESEWRRFGKDIRALVGDDPDIVFEHPGRQTMGASVFACKRAGTIVTCAATSGYMIEYDNRHLWMKLKTIKGSHFANYREAWDANRLVCEGKIVPPLSAVYPLTEVGEAAYQVHQNLHEGKIGVLCLAPSEGLGIDDPELRAAHRRGPAHRCSGGTGRERDRRGPGRPVDRDRPRGHRRQRPRRGRRLVRRGVRGHRRPPRAGRLRRRRRGPAGGGRLLHPAAHPDPGRLAGGQVPGGQGARASTTSATGWPTAPRPSRRSRTPEAGSSTRPPGPGRGGRRWPSSTPRPRSGP